MDVQPIIEVDHHGVNRDPMFERAVFMPHSS